MTGKEAERVQLLERRTGRAVLSPPVSAKAAAGLACAKATFQAGMRQSRMPEMTGPHALFSRTLTMIGCEGRRDDEKACQTAALAKAEAW
jgi:hypothetical protein